MYTVDIDVGGTLTDGIFSDGAARLECIKVDTTPHDLTVCLFDCLNSGAAKLGFADLTAFLEKVDLVRWSTTVTSNVLAEGRGPKIGLLVTKGHEKDLYGDQPVSPALARLISEHDIIGLDPAHSETEVMNAVRCLLETGARRICVSLQGGLHDPVRELRIKGIVDRQYPDHFLGSVPVLVGSDICKNGDDATRTYYALINAYTHGALASTLFKAEDELRQNGLSRSFLISHINGGVAGVAKTKAIDTMESGPILGIHASATLARLYDLNKVVALDVGGTTAKAGIVHNAQPLYHKPSDLFGIPVGVSLPYLRSIALGGGSVVKVRHTAASAKEKIQLGPESMGSFPGPACYALGGDQATLTDAFVAAGIINPDYFLGGAKQIDLKVAQGAMQQLVAQPLGQSIGQACGEVIDRAFDLVARLIESARTELRRDLTDHALFAYGGNGGLFACGVGERIGIECVYLFSLGPVFSAFGSAVSDIRHVYERVCPMRLDSETALNRLNPVIEDLKKEAVKDLLGEAIEPERLAWSVELEVSSGGVTRTIAPADIPSDGSVHLELVRVGVSKPIPKPPLAERQAPADSSPAPIGRRNVSCGSGSQAASIFRWESLRPGDAIRGCAVLEGANSTYFVPEGWLLKIDAYGNGRATREH